MKENPFISNVELLSTRSTFAKMDSNDAVEVEEEVKEDAREEATDVDGRDPTEALLGGGGGHTEAVSCFLRLGVLVFIVCC